MNTQNIEKYCKNWEFDQFFMKEIEGIVFTIQKPFNTWVFTVSEGVNEIYSQSVRNLSDLMYVLNIVQAYEQNLEVIF